MALIRYINWHRLHVPKDGATAATDVHTQLSMSSPAQHRIPSRSRERGAEMLEFAFVFAGLMMLMLGIFNFARAYNIYETVTRAAREGAREAVLPTAANLGNKLTYITGDGACPATPTNTPNTSIFNYFIRPALDASSVNPAGIQNYRECLTWLDPPGTVANQCGILVSFQFPYQFSIPFLGPGLGTIDIGTDVQMRLENQPIGSGATCGGVTAP